MAETADQLAIQESTISDDIDDYVSENPIEDDASSYMDMYELEKLVTRAEELRTSFRMKHKELLHEMGQEPYAQKYGVQRDEKIKLLKDYIMKVKAACKTIKSKARAVDDGKKSREADAFRFLFDDIARSIVDLETKVNVKCTTLQDSEIAELKEDIPSITSSIVSISKRFPELLQLKEYEKKYEGVSIESLNNRYEKVVKAKVDLVTNLKSESRVRELEKQERFKEGKLNIKLNKFKGYSSTTDFYTFRNDFEKIHLRSTPKHMLPDLLKNNYLDDPALSLVKSLTDIEEIWKRLKDSYGDPKMMLDLKFGEINSIDAPTKWRDPEKTAVGLTKIINLMKDLLKLSKDHSIENKLYHDGDGLQRIMKLLGNHRVDRFLSQGSELNLDDNASWMNLIEFLEKELKVQQRKVLVLGKGEPSKDKDKPEDKGARDKKPDNRNASSHQSHHSSPDGGKNNQPKLICAICDGDDHVPTMGPGYLTSPTAHLYKTGRL